MPPIVFTDDDFHGLDHQQDDPMVITIEIENYVVKKVLVDQGRSVVILYWTTYQKLQLPDTAMIPYDDPRIGRDVRLEPVEDTTPLELPNGHSINLGTGLNSDEHATITPILINNTDLFAWSAADLPGVDPQVASHKLSIYKEARYVSQKKRKLGEERRQAAKVEADKLLSVGFIEEAQYTTWLSNIVLVKKANGKWRMCVDYTDLNKACPRDAYPLPNIDRLVDGVAGNKVLSFLDAYSGYNQIPMATADMHKTAFITDDAKYFYRVMPFGLKNRGNLPATNG